MRCQAQTFFHRHETVMLPQAGVIWSSRGFLPCSSRTTFFLSACGMNVHHRCQTKVANLCGINQKLMAEALAMIESTQQVKPQEAVEIPPVSPPQGPLESFALSLCHPNRMSQGVLLNTCLGLFIFLPILPPLRCLLNSCVCVLSYNIINSS